MGELIQVFKDFNLIMFLLLISLLLSFVATGYTLLLRHTTKALIKTKLHDARRKSLQEAINSSELKKLGEFLDSTVGQFDVSEYASDNNVKQLVDTYFDGVLNFIGSNEPEVTSQIDLEKIIHSPKNLDDKKPSTKTDNYITKEFQGITERLENGKEWDALARTRMVIEKTLRQKIAAKTLSKSERHYGTGRLARVAHHEKLINSNDLEYLLVAINTCNRAIHGLDIDLNQAHTAIELAKRVLIKL